MDRNALGQFMGTGTPAARGRYVDTRNGSRTVAAMNHNESPTAPLNYGTLVEFLRAHTTTARWDRARKLSGSVRIRELTSEGVDAFVAGRSGVYRVQIGRSAHEAKLWCSCPDDTTFCKHVAATALAAEETAELERLVAASVEPDPAPESADLPAPDADVSDDAPADEADDEADEVALLVAHVEWDFKDPLTVTVWAETNTAAEWFPGRPGRRTRLTRPHPYAATAEELAAVVDVPDFALEDAEPVQLAVTLESVSRIPYPSAAAVGGGRPEPRGKLRPAPWTVGALRCIGWDAVRALRAIACLEEEGHWVVATPDGTAVYDIYEVAHAAADAAQAVIDAAAAPCFEWSAELHLALAEPAATEENDDAPEADRWEAKLIVRGANGATRTPTQLRGVTYSNTGEWAAVTKLNAAALTLRRLSGELDDIRHTDMAQVSTDTVVALLDAQVQLAAAGVELFVPAGLRRLTRMKVDTHVTPGDGTLGLEALCAFAFTAEINGTHLDAEALASLAALERRLIPTLDGLVVLTRAQAAALRKVLASKTVMDALSVTSSGFDGIEFDEPTADGWLANLLDGDGPSSESVVDVGPLFSGALFDYQQAAVDRISFLAQHHLGALLFDEMGLGKTVVGLALTAADLHADPAAGPTLVLAPNSMMMVWAKEAARFCPTLNVVVAHNGDDGVPVPAALEVGADIVVTTHTTARNHIELYADRRWHRVIIDEAHVAKKQSTQMHQAFRELRADQVVVATGTPVQNGLEDLHAVTSIAVPGLLGAAAPFARRYARPLRDGSPNADLLAEEVRSRIAPFMVMRNKSDVGLDEDLPAKTEETVLFDVTSEQHRMLWRSAEATVEAAERATTAFGRGGPVLAGITRSKQIANHPENLVRTGGRLPGRSPKLDWTLGAVQEHAATGESTLIFTQYKQMAEILVEALAGVVPSERIGFIHGDVAPEKRSLFGGRLDAGELDVVVIVIQAGGVGLTLTGANHVVLYDRWWNPAIEDQAIGRCYRIGQTRPITVHRLMCNDTIEVAIGKTLDGKRGVAARLFGVAGSEAAMSRELIRVDSDALREALAGAVADRHREGVAA